MISFIESNQQRSVIFFVAMCLVLTVIGLYSVTVSPPSFVHHEPLFLFGMLDVFEAVVAGLSFWLVMTMLLGVLWSRVLFGGSTMLEAWILGSVLITVAFPLMTTSLSFVLGVLSRVGLIAPPSLGGVDVVYALLGVLTLFVIGLLILVGKEVLVAARPHTEHSRYE